MTAGIPTAFLAPNLLRDGYTFEGWFTADGTEYIGGQILNLSANLELFAHWTANNYTIRFDANGGIGTMADQVFTFEDSTPLSPNQFTREGYTFLEWAFVADGTGAPVPDDVTVADPEYIDNKADTNGVVTLYAQWKANTP